MLNPQLKNMKRFSMIATLLNEMTDDVEFNEITDTELDLVTKWSIDLKGGSIIWDKYTNAIYVKPACEEVETDQN